MERDNQKRKGDRKMKHTTRSEAVEAALAKYPKARRIAVENSTFGQEDSIIFRMNIEQDYALYNWNAHTMSAINYVMRNSCAREGVTA
jgi:hypothetical protein